MKKPCLWAIAIIVSAGYAEFDLNPARLSEPSFGFAYGRIPAAEQTDFWAVGEFGNSRYRVASVANYSLMDSIYRRIYMEWDVSLNFDRVILGAGYGLPLEWIPGDSFWFRHRYKVGVAYMHKGVTLSTMGWNYTSESFSCLKYLVEIYVKPGSRLDAFAWWDGTSALVGSSLNFRVLSVKNFYRFPDFALGAVVEFHFGSWDAGGFVGELDRSLYMFGFGVKNKVSKKTIL